MTRTLLALVLTCGIATAADRPLVVAHRGASEDAPENTLAAFRLAWEQGADAVEGDFYLSIDGHVVCLHDKTTQRTADRDLNVSRATLAELRSLDVGHWKAAKFAGERLPTLAEVFATVPRGKLVYVEVKCGPEIVPALERILKETRFPRTQVRVIAFDADVVAAAKRAMPDVRAFWLTDFKRKTKSAPWQPSPEAILATLEKTGADGAGCQANRDVVDAALVARFHEAGRELHVWTVDDLDAAAKLAATGVDSITTNRPGLVRERLDAKSP